MDASLVFGGWYTWMDPVVRGGPDGGADVLWAGAWTALFSLPLWFGAATALTRSARIGGVATLLLATSGAFLRVGPTESMYGVALVYTAMVVWWTELLVRTPRLWAAVGLLPWALLAMHTRADLLLLTPWWVALRLTTTGAAGALVTRPAAWLLALSAGSALVPRLVDLGNVETPGEAGEMDLTRDLRVVFLFLLAAWAAALHPWVAARLPARPVMPAVAAGLALAGAAIGWWAYRPPGYDPGPHVHMSIDPSHGGSLMLTVALMVGAMTLRGTQAATASGLLTFVSTALLLYLGRYDCASTYGATSLYVAPFLAIVAASVATSRGWSTSLFVALVGASSALAAAPMALARSPKAETAALLAQARLLPAGTVLVALADEDLPAAPGAWKVDRLPLRRLLPDHLQLRTVDEWEADPVPAVFLRSLDCHRPALSRDGDQARVDDDERAVWTRNETPLVHEGHRITLDPPTVSWGDCERLDQRAGPALWERIVSAKTTGSIYEEAFAPELRIGLYPLR